jgi:hypothetical protein
MIRFTFCLILCLFFSAAHAQVGTGFTYQGRLQDGAQPANGLFDFEFRLHDAANAGAQIGGTFTLNDVPVQQGVFSVLLDFGAGVFTGNGRWLAISVRDGASTGAYDLLAPRQALTAAPYAQYALSGSPGPAGTTGQDIFTAYSSGAVGVTPQTGFTLIPGMTLTLTVPAASKVLVSTTGGLTTTSTQPTGFSVVDVAVYVDGVLLPESQTRLFVLNNGGTTGINVIENWAITAAPVLSPGTHTISVSTRGLGTGDNANVGGGATSVLRGKLIVSIIKQ